MTSNPWLSLVLPSTLSLYKMLPVSRTSQTRGDASIPASFLRAIQNVSADKWITTEAAKRVDWALNGAWASDETVRYVQWKRWTFYNIMTQGTWLLLWKRISGCFIVCDHQWRITKDSKDSKQWTNQITITDEKKDEKWLPQHQNTPK